MTNALRTAQSPKGARRRFEESCNRPSALALFSWVFPIRPNSLPQATPMNRSSSLAMLLALAATNGVQAQDWPQWLGPARNAKATGFQAPASWPKALTQAWKVTVGEGVATPALVGDRLYVFSRQDGSEVLRCLHVTDGKELWQDRYDALGASGPAGGFSGPRSSPAVAQGKVVTLGVRGMLSSVDAATGKPLWRKDDFKAYPNFHPSSSPLIVGNLAVAQLGGRENGAIVAYDLVSGDEKWKWNGPSPGYASPVLLTVGASQYVVAQTEAKLVAVDATTGKLAWESEAAAPAGGPGGGPGGPGGPGGGGGRGGGRDYKASTPIVDGQTLIIAGRTIRALRLEKSGDQLAAKELWSNAEKSVQFNTPTLKNGLLFGLTGANELFCIRTKDGTTAWSAPFPASPTPEGQPPRPAAQRPSANPAVAGLVMAQADPAPPGGGPGRPRGPGGPGGGPGGRRGGMGGGAGYGNIVDAGSALIAITPAGELVVFEPNDTGLKVLANYKVAAGQTHAYPVLSGKRIVIKDKDDLTLWTVE